MTRAGREIIGVRVNEDAFTLELRDESGRFHSFDKRDLNSLEKRSQTSLMPSYAKMLSPAELDDLVAYLAGLGGAK